MRFTSAAVTVWFLVAHSFSTTSTVDSFLSPVSHTALVTRTSTTTSTDRITRSLPPVIQQENKVYKTDTALFSSTTSTMTSSTKNPGDGKFHFAIDRGGTFTDVFCRLPDGSEIVRKLLSEDPSHYADAPTEGIRRVLEEFDTARDYPRSKPVATSQIGSIRMGTTVATNALLERDGARMALLITKGFGDVLEIGNQSRPDIFDLTCSKPSLLYEKVVEIDERVVLSQFCPSKKNPFWQDYPKFKGLTGEEVQVCHEPDLEAIKKELEKLRDEGIEALAICLMHGYTYAKHEQAIGELAESMGCFPQISLSSGVMPMVKLVSRGHTTCAAAYLTPKINAYLASFKEGFDADLSKVPLTFMKSDGGLAPDGGFGGHQAILSGPAGGVVGYAKTSFYPKDQQPVIGFDMGGTSTDVSRYDGQWELVFETVTAGVAIQAYVYRIASCCLHIS